MAVGQHFIGDLIDLEVEERDLLAQVVVQLSRNPLALLLLAHDDAAGERSIELDCALRLSDVADDAQDAAVVRGYEARLEISEFIERQARTPRRWVRHSSAPSRVRP